MKQKFELKVIQPCYMPWQEMEKVGDGRYCQQCDKILTDYRNIPDEEIVKLIARSGKSPCGIFRKSQLNRPLRAPRFSFTKLLYRIGRMAFALLLAASALRTEVDAQEVVQQTEQQQRAHIDKAKKDSPSKRDTTRRALQYELKGRVVDADKNSKRQLAYARVEISALGLTTSCDLNGNFTLCLPCSDLIPNLYLECKYLFYKGVRVDIDTSQSFVLLPMSYDQQEYDEFMLEKARERARKEAEEQEDDDTEMGSPAVPSWRTP